MVETTDIEKFKQRTPSAVRLIAFFKAKKGRGDDLEKVLMTLVGPTRKEQGNISYVLHRSDQNSDELIFDELWADRKALDDHVKRPYIQSLKQKIESLLEKPVELKTYYEVTSGLTHLR